MPTFRRPSAAAAYASPSAGSSRTHKPAESHHGVSQSHSLSSLGSSATPQQKMVQVLVTRLRNKLPCNSGTPLERLEAESAVQQTIAALVHLATDSLDIIAWALAEQLERLAKQTNHTGHLTLEVLQSQLFLLKVLTAAMASRWQFNVARAGTPASFRAPGSAPDSPLPASSSKRSYEQNHTPPSIASEPPPLDENCAKYILSVMVMFLRQTNPTDVHIAPGRAADTTFFSTDQTLPSSPIILSQSTTPIDTSTAHLPEVVRRELRNRASANSVNSTTQSLNSSLTLPVGSIDYEKTHLDHAKSTYAVNELVSKFAGRVIFHISASNWKVVFARLRTKIYYLAGYAENDIPDTVDLHVLCYSILDRQRLIQILNELSSLLVNMNPDIQISIAVPLRTAVWNWIEFFPQQFNESARFRGKMEGSPERVFDLLIAKVRSGDEKILWPTLTALNCITSDRMNAEASRGQKAGAKFIQDLSSQSQMAKLGETRVVCCLDICRAAFHLEPSEDFPLRSLALDIAHDLRSLLFTHPITRPFWDPSVDEIDVLVLSEGLVAIFRLLSPEDSLEAFSVCLEPERSEAVKTVAVKACLTLVQEAARFSWQKPLVALAQHVAHRCRDIFKTAGLRKTEMDQYGNLRRISQRPKARKIGYQSLSDRESLLLSILSLWQLDRVFFTSGFTGLNVEDFHTTSIKLWEAPNLHKTIKYSVAISCRINAELAFADQYTDDEKQTMPDYVRRSLQSTLLNVATNLIHTREDLETQRLWVGVAIQYLQLFLTRCNLDHIREMQLHPGRGSAFAVTEIACLISLTSADTDVSNLSAQGLRLLSFAERQPDAPPNPVMSSEERAKRHNVYEQLGDPKVTVFGRVGHQKRMRKLLRLVANPSATHVAVWTECYWRWRMLTEGMSDIVKDSHTTDDVTSQRNIVAGLSTEQRFHWHNLTMFLAALCGPCILDPPDLELTSLSDKLLHRDIPDSLRTLKPTKDSVIAFVGELTRLLMSEDTQVRDIAREALGAELSPRLYPRLLKHIEDILNHLGTKDLTSQQNFSLFADQFMSVIKLIVENTQVVLEEVMTIDISPVVLGFARFIARVNNIGIRLKMKFCNLVDSVCESTVLTLRKDSVARHSILDFIVDWVQSPEQLTAEWATMQSELNMACLRTAVKLLDRLELRPLDSSSSTAGDDTVHVVSRLFNKYSLILLNGLEYCRLDLLTSDAASDAGSIQQKMRASQREAEIRELVITGLSHLVIANAECGFKQCLALAYHDDPRKRTIFAHVFARVIGQGTKFDTADPVVTLSRHSRLSQLVKQSDMTLVLAICETCPASDVEGMISVLLNMFDTRASLMTLIKLMIDREVARTESEASLLRSNSTCARFLSAFSRIHGYNYLRSLVQPLVRVMDTMPQGYELDPGKVPPGQDVAQNRKQVELVAASFLDILESSTPTIPSMFREICVHITKTVVAVWPDAKFAALGAFIFLRFISPAVVAPETIDIELPNESLRKGLMVVAKIIQNMANNIFFGKEAHMTPLNDFLGEHIADVTRYLSTINRYAPDDEEEDEWLGTTSDDTDIIVLHRFFDKHADKIGKELLSISKPSESDAAAINGKRAWDNLCTLLVDLGPPLEVPKLSPLSSSNHPDYIELMEHFQNRGTDPVADIFIEADVPANEDAIFVFRLSRIDVETLDLEMLMYHIFKLLAAPNNTGRSFSLVLECTGFVSNSEVPLRWLKYCAELIPSDIRSRFLTTYVLNPNALTLKYLRRLYNVAAGIPVCGDVKVCASVTELLDHVPESVVTALAVPWKLEQEPGDEFSDVMMKTSSHMRSPVVLLVGQTHLRITSVRAQTISTALTCRATEIIPIGDIGDVYNVLTGQEVLNEFIIRRNRSSSTIYLTAPAREIIVKAIRLAKSRLKDTQSPLSERFSRFSNVPATLLHVGLLSVDLNDEELRAAAYDLLGAVCSYLNYDKNAVVAAKAGFIPGDPTTFVLQLSERMAEFAPQLTLDFISEVSATMNSMEKRSSSHVAQRISCLQYMGPWIKNLSHFSNPNSPLYERSGARLRDCVRVLCDASIAFPQLTSCFQQYVWTEVAKMDTVAVDVVLDELVRLALDAGIGTHRCETIANIVASLSSISVRGRLYSRLRKAIVKASPTLEKAADKFLDNPSWGEVSTLLRLALVAGCQVKQPAQNRLYVPEVAHIVTLVAGIGTTIVRKSVYGIMINLLQSLHMASAEDSSIKSTDILPLIQEFLSPEVLQLFGLARPAPTSEYINFDPPNDKINIDHQEELARLIAKTLEVAAGNKGLLNVWRARWMSLATASAFQYSSIIQMRSFTVLGNLASVGVDDDLLYQMLVALKNALSHTDESDTLAVVSMLRTLSKVAAGLPDMSRFLPQLVWLAVTFLQAGHITFYIEANRLLQNTLLDIERRGLFKETSAPLFLLDARRELEDVATQFDQVLQLSFEPSTFSFTLAAVIFKGVRQSALRDSAEAILRTLLSVTVQSAENYTVNGIKDTLRPDILGYFLALLPFCTTTSDYQRLLEDCQADDSWLPERGDDLDEELLVPRVSPAFLGITDSSTALLVTSFIQAILSTAQGDDTETEMLFALLVDIAALFPDIVAMTYEGLQDRIRDILSSSNNPDIIHHASDILKVTLSENPRIGSSTTLRGASVSTVNTTDDASIHGPGRNHVNALEELNMRGLVNSFAFVQGPSATKVIQWMPALVGIIIT